MASARCPGPAHGESQLRLTSDRRGLNARGGQGTAELVAEDEGWADRIVPMKDGPVHSG